jgi:hypothetical protein
MQHQVAVITADVVNSTRFRSDQTSAWLNNLLTELRSDPTFDWALKPEVYRGDSFQGVIRKPEDALRLAILTRVIMRSNNKGTDLRIAIGIGGVDHLTERAGTSDGEAFRLSGRLADQIRDRKAKIGFALTSPAPALDSSMDLLETLIEGWTAAQCEVVYGLLMNRNISQIAETLSISQSAASQRAASAKWWAIASILSTFPEHLILYTPS